MNILVGISGSIAAKLCGKINIALKEHSVKYVMTQSAFKIHEGVDFDYELYEEWNKVGYDLFSDAEEWDKYKENKSVLHIDLTKWADCFIIAPCSMNTLAKVANGICDNLLTCCARAWDFNNSEKKMILAPAGNTKMWQHPVTKEHLDKIKSWQRHYFYDRLGYQREGLNSLDIKNLDIKNDSVEILDPISKELFCGDIGVGAMGHVDDLKIMVDEFNKYLLKGKSEKQGFNS